MWPRFGIKLGNSTFCIALAKEDEKIEIIANKQGERVTSATCLLNDNREIEVAPEKQKMSAKPYLTITNNLQFMNEMADEDIARAVGTVSCNFNTATKEYDLKTPEESLLSVSPYKVCVEFFKACFELARQYHNADEAPIAIICVPHYFSEPASWTKLAKAAEEAGFITAQVIADSTAALLAYGFDEIESDQDSRTVLAIKSGGLCSSFVLYDVSDGFYSIINSAGPFYIGGKQITDVLVEFISQEFYKKYRLDPSESRRSAAKIRIAADNCKSILSTMPSTQIYIDSLMDGIDFSMQLSRARFESLIQTVLNDFISTLNTALGEMNKTERIIDEIVLMGATIAIPKLQSMIGAMFQHAKLNNKFSPDEVVAIGCGRQSIFVEPNIQELIQNLKISVTTTDLFIWHDNMHETDEEDSQRKQLVCKKGSTLPYLIKLDVEKSYLESSIDEVHEEEVNFKIQYENQVYKILAKNVKLKCGFYTIEADMNIDNNNLNFSIKSL